MMRRYFVLVLFGSLISGCATHSPMKTVDYVELERFMGRWYVIANIPTFLEKNAVNAIEEYTLNNDGTIATTFSFREGDVNGKLRQYKPKGFVVPDTGNAEWGMQFIWPIKADFRIVHLSEDYSETIIARQARDYVWLMARTPDMDSEQYKLLLQKIQSLGYDLSKINRVHHDWENLTGAES